MCLSFIGQSDSRAQNGPTGLLAAIGNWKVEPKFSSEGFMIKSGFCSRYSSKILGFRMESFSKLLIQLSWPTRTDFHGSNRLNDII